MSARVEDGLVALSLDNLEALAVDARFVNTPYGKRVLSVLERRRAGAAALAGRAGTPPPASLASLTPPRREVRVSSKRKGQGHKPGEMNKLEQSFAHHLAEEKAVGAIVDYGFEELKLKVGKTRCWYTADFWILHHDGHLELVETKGARKPGYAPGSKMDVHPEGRVKFEAAAMMYPMFDWRKIDRSKEKGWVTLRHYPIVRAA